MIITCQQCSTSYHLDETLLKPEGTKVRCTACKTIFTAYPTADTSPQHKSDSTASFEESRSQVFSRSDHPDEMEVSDDIARALGQDLDENDLDHDEEINQLPSDMIHEIDDDDDVNFDSIGYDEPSHEDDFNISDSTFDLTDGNETIEEVDKAPSDDIELSPEDLDLVNGYKSDSYKITTDEESDLKQEPAEDEKSSDEKIAYEDDSVTLSEEDLDLGVSMAAHALTNDFTEEKDSDTGQEEQPLSTEESEKEEIKGLEDDLQFDDQKDDTPQIDIGAELDLEFGSEIEEEIPEMSDSEDLDMELTLDDLNESGADIANDVDLGLDIDFDKAFDSEDVLDEKEDIDLKLNSEPEQITSDKGIEDEFDLQLDIDDADQNDSVEATGSDDDFNLDLDFDDSEESKELNEDLGLSLNGEEDFGLSLDFEDEKEDEEPKESLDISSAKDDDFDLSLDFDDGNEEDLGLSLEKDDDFDLDLGFDDSKAEQESSEDLDISLSKDDDFDLDLDIDDKDEASSGDDFSFDLDLDENLEDAQDDDRAEIDEELELDFSGAESEAEPSSADDLDLSDLQDLLDTEQTKEKPSVASDESDDFNLADLENALDGDQNDQDRTSLADDDDLELDLDIESDLAETVAVSSPGKDFSAELDLSEFEYLSDSDEKSPADDHFDTGDMELEFQVEDPPTEDQPIAPELESKTPPQQALESPSDKTLVFSETPFTEAGEDEVDYEEDSISPKKRGVSKTLVFLLVIVILIGGGYCAWVLLDGMGIQIPFVSDYINPKIEDPGNLKLQTEDINSKFIDNTTAGRLFVITGKVSSSYDKPRRFIQMTGKLFTKGKKLAKTEIVYCGNVISDNELTTLDIGLIKKRLADRFGGDQKAVTMVQPGQTLPFMVVFSDLPKEQLEEFTIEVDKSTEEAAN